MHPFTIMVNYCILLALGQPPPGAYGYGGYGGAIAGARRLRVDNW